MERLLQGSVTSPLGFVAGTASCGLKESGAPDLALLLSRFDCSAAGVFTQSQIAAAPVLLDRETLAANPGAQRGVVTNSGVANACTGASGLEAARGMQRAAAQAVGCEPSQMLVLSTGVIGRPLPLAAIEVGIATAASRLAPEHGSAAAQAIMTTDTVPKSAALALEGPSGRITLGGMAKGAGMIHPDMATMLAVLTTDAAAPADLVDRLLREAVDQSFNRISVDGDTSTNDTVLLLANGASGLSLTDAEIETEFSEILHTLCRELAQAIVRDGEGSTKFVSLTVMGAPTQDDAARVARAIGTSPLVKTAFAGGDPNWGRVLAAAGRAGISLDPSRLDLWIGGDGGELQLVHSGAATDFRESEAGAIMARSEFSLRLDLGTGEGEATLWTCDLTE